MELEVINNKIKHVYIHIIQIMNMTYIGSGENANNNNRLYTLLYELFYKIKGARKLFKAITELILNISIFYDFTKISLNDFLIAIKQNPNLSFTIIKDNV